MIRLTHPDDVLIASPTRTITWVGEERIRLAFWSLFRRVRRAWTLRALPFIELVALEQALDIEGRVGYVERLGCIIRAYGLRGTAHIPLETAMAIEAAHYQVSYPPKAMAQADRSPAAPSSDVSAPGTDGASSTSPA